MKWLLAALLLPMSQISHAQEQNCTVLSVSDKPSFFGIRSGRIPNLGDQINIDFSKQEITDLTFTEGRAIPIARYETVLKKVDHGNTFDLFTGRREGMMGTYEGFMSVVHKTDESVVSFVATNSRTDPVNVFELSMRCEVPAAPAPQ